MQPQWHILRDSPRSPYHVALQRLASNVLLQGALQVTLSFDIEAKSDEDVVALVRMLTAHLDVFRKRGP